MITSAQNPKLKQVRALGAHSKARQQTGTFLAEGVRLLEEALAAGWPIRFALYSDEVSDRGKELVRKMKAASIVVDKVTGDLLQTASQTETSQGVLAVLEQTALPLPRFPTFILIPDLIRDPGNLGTLIRTAAVTGVQTVLLPPGTADAFSPKVVRAGAGAHFRMPIRDMSWEEITQVCKPAKMRVLLADMEGIPCWGTDFRGPLALIVGGEATGASKEARDFAETTISIPMPGGGESLNAAIAGAIMMFEVVRQRWENQP